MIYTPLTNRALRISYDAHAGQVDKCGTPYVFHPYHVAEQMEDEVTACVALLHDVAEDTDVTLSDLAREFPAEVIEALRLLTHQPGVPYLDYVRSLAADPVARAVKRADLRHNMDETRYAGGTQPTADALERRRVTYRAALAILEEAEASEAVG
ncbi:HD domain-containing protein [Collinsella intestinalis]|uniref:HD domain-containing protein n=1 Tax=Collinsella intestinalis TaxID=147207 RepID=UPI0019588284|nr:HD domain-containing protein [Collinsella intestinalis]MBM6907472.1 HD domain-containing protein [Collinsella intestinalis]